MQQLVGTSMSRDKRYDFLLFIGRVATRYLSDLYPHVCYVILRQPFFPLPSLTLFLDSYSKATAQSRTGNLQLYAALPIEL